MAAIVQQTNEANPAVLQVPGVENWVTKSVLAGARKWTAGRRSQDDICAAAALQSCRASGRKAYREARHRGVFATTDNR